MANKIKVFVGFLALIALVSVLSLFDSFRSSSLVGKTADIAKSSLSFAVDTDVDKDGLSNRDESYWNTDFQNLDTDGDGFLDGEEVASGHDPLIPAPNDVIDNGNLTAKLSNLTLAGLYTGSLKSDNPQYQKSLYDLTSVVLDDASQSLQGDVSNIKLRTIDSSKKSQEEYIRSLSDIFGQFVLSYFSEMNSFQANLDKLGESGFGKKEISNYFEIKTAEFQEILNKGLEISVPQNWEMTHLGFLKLVKELVESNRSIASGSKDPVKAMAALNRVAGVLDILPGITENFSKKIRDQKVNVQSTIFER